MESIPSNENPRKRFKAELPSIPEIPEDHDASGGHDASSGYDVSGGHDAHAPILLEYYHPGCIFSMPLPRIKIILETTPTTTPTAMQFARERIAWNIEHNVSSTQNARWERWLQSPKMTEASALYEFLMLEKTNALEHV